MTVQLPEIKNIIFITLFVKASVFALIFFAFSLLPFQRFAYMGNFVYPPHSPITLQTAYSTWDAQHYLFLSEKGYQPGNDSNAFPPLFPLFIRLGSYITHNSFWSGIILSNIFSLFAFILFYLLVKSLYNKEIAFNSFLFLLAFPTSFYFSLIYTESLFLFLVLLFFFFLKKKQVLAASAAAFFLPLTRLIGIAIIIPFLTSFTFEYHKHSLCDEVIVILKSLFQIKTLFIFSPLLGLFVSMIVMYLTTGNLFTQFIVQQNFISHYSLTALFNPIFFLKAFFTFPLKIHGFTDSLIDRAFFIGFIGLLPLLVRRISKTFFAYTVLFGLLTVLSGSFMSYTRYLVVVFPIFIGLGILSQEKKYKMYTFPFLYVCLLLQGFFIIMHGLNYWVA